MKFESVLFVGGPLAGKFVTVENDPDVVRAINPIEVLPTSGSMLESCKTNDVSYYRVKLHDGETVPPTEFSVFFSPSEGVETLLQHLLSAYQRQHNPLVQLGPLVKK